MRVTGRVREGEKEIVNLEIFNEVQFITFVQKVFQ